MIWAILLAAGKSERMGRLKPLLPFRGKTFLEVLFDTFKSSTIGKNIRIVLGYQAEAILSTSSIPEDYFTINRNFEKGQLSSLKAGIESIQQLEQEEIISCEDAEPEEVTTRYRLKPEGVMTRQGLEPEGILVHPVDHPLLQAETVDLLVKAFHSKIHEKKRKQITGEGGKVIVAPRYRGERGRPVIFSWDMAPEMLSLPPDSRPRDLIDKYGNALLLVDVDDEGVTFGVNDPEDYEKLVRKQKENKSVKK